MGNWGFSVIHPCLILGVVNLRPSGEFSYSPGIGISDLLSRWEPWKQISLAPLLRNARMRLHICGLNSISINQFPIKGLEYSNRRFLQLAITHFIEHPCESYKRCCRPKLTDKSTKNILWSFWRNTFLSIIGEPMHESQEFASNANRTDFWSPS